MTCACPNDTMAVTVGSRLGHYDVTALIGEGGMGQVYQATDTKLNRQSGPYRGRLLNARSWQTDSHRGRATSSLWIGCTPPLDVGLCLGRLLVSDSRFRNLFGPAIEWSLGTS